MSKEDMMNKISFALKDPILQRDLKLFVVNFQDLKKKMQKKNIGCLLMDFVEVI